MKHQKYVSVSNCRVHDEPSEIWCQYLVVEYTMKYQIYLSVSSCTVYDKESEICANI